MKHKEKSKGKQIKKTNRDKSDKKEEQRKGSRNEKEGQIKKLRYNLSGS